MPAWDDGFPSSLIDRAGLVRSLFGEPRSRLQIRRTHAKRPATLQTVPSVVQGVVSLVKQAAACAAEIACAIAQSVKARPNDSSRTAHHAAQPIHHLARAAENLTGPAKGLSLAGPGAESPHGVNVIRGDAGGVLSRGDDRGTNWPAGPDDPIGSLGRGRNRG